MSIAALISRIARQKKSLLLLVLIVSVVVTYFAPSNEMSFVRRTASDVSDDDRPIMHTFYEKVGRGDDDLLEAWKEEWTIAGFEAKVLTLKDAKRHSYFTEMEKFVKPHFGTGYNAMCLYRWLAMAASGGGWMCDYDTFPTNFPMKEARRLPGDGRLTSFESHTPSLVSGTADEWSRVSKKLIEVMPKVEMDIKSDMHAFVVVKKEGSKNQVDFRNARLNLREGFVYKKAFSPDVPREVDCKAMAIGRAVHLAHRYTYESLERGMFPLPDVKSPYEAIVHRGEAARIFMADWRQQCGGSNIE